MVKYTRKSPVNATDIPQLNCNKPNMFYLLTLAICKATKKMNFAGRLVVFILIPQKAALSLIIRWDESSDTTGERLGARPKAYLTWPRREDETSPIPKLRT